ncbi:MAG: hypothetical protein V1670_04375, partial [Candidatus Omnitrophota bacterium]
MGVFEVPACRQAGVSAKKLPRHDPLIVENMNIRTIDWKNNKIRIIDQTKLPLKLVYIDIDKLKSLWQAIKELKVRG